MAAGLPNREHRPGLFMCVGPPAFTALALIGMAKGLPSTASQNVTGMPVDLNMIRTMALMSAIFLWSVSLWWFGIAVVAVVQSVPEYFHLGWWAMGLPKHRFHLGNDFYRQGARQRGQFCGLLPALVFAWSPCTFLCCSSILRLSSLRTLCTLGETRDVEDH